VSVAIVMPAWNEASGIGEFLREIHETFAGIEHTIVVVDDSSTDSTLEVLTQLKSGGLPLVIQSNPKNMGHGPTTINALKGGLATGATSIIALDGDGQFLGEDILKCYKALIDGNFQIVEGVRTRDSDPAYRKITSYATRVLVWSRCRELPQDANTPLRAYERQTLQVILTKVPANSLVPNLMISAYARVNSLNVGVIPVRFIDRRGDNPQSTTWGKSKSNLPSKRFVKFCRDATRSWLAFDPRS
jgi:dolichol-phosphate mannosyltransferase